MNRTRSCCQSIIALALVVTACGEETAFPPRTELSLQRSLTLSSELDIPARGGSLTAQLEPALVVTDAGYLLLWQERDDAGVTDALGMRLNGAGDLVDATPFVIAPSIHAGGLLSAAATSQRVMVASLCPGPTVSACVSEVVGSGAAPARPWGATDVGSGPALTSGPQGVLGVLSNNGASLTVQQFSDDGGVRHDGGLPLTSGTLYQFHPAPSCDSTGCTVCWYDVSTGTSFINCRRLDAFGQPLFAQSTATCCAAGNSHSSLALEEDGGLLAWEDARAGNRDVYLSQVSANGQILQPNGKVLAVGAGEQRAPALRFDGQGYWAAWQDDATGLTQLWPLNTSGTRLDGGVSFAGTNPRLGVSAPGVGLVLYQVDAGSTLRLRARLFAFTSTPDAGAALDGGGGAAPTQSGVDDGGRTVAAPPDERGAASYGVGCGCSSAHAPFFVGILAWTRPRRGRRRHATRPSSE